MGAPEGNVGRRGQKKSEEAKREVERSKGARSNTKSQDFSRENV